MKFSCNTNVNGFLWNIMFTEDEPLLLVNNHRCKGSIVYKSRTIYIDSSVNKTSMKRILAHELTHAVLYDTQMCLKEEYNEEDMCEFCGLYATVIHNITRNCIKKFKHYVRSNVAVS